MSITAVFGRVGERERERGRERERERLLGSSSETGQWATFGHESRRMIRKTDVVSLSLSLSLPRSLSLSLSR